MGACASSDRFNAFSKKVIRISYLEDSSDVPQGKVNYLDVESNDFNSFNVKIFPFKNLDSISQLVIDNTLYILGDQDSKCNAGAFFLKCDLTDKNIQLSILINSTHEHYKSSLTVFKRDFIIAIGGKNSIKCEIYHKQSNKWRTLPDLPEEKYGCGLLTDDSNDLLYCFGGCNSKMTYFSNNILRINLKNSNKWDVLPIKDSSLIEKAFFTLVKTAKDKILIIGGSQINKEFCDDIVEYDMNHKTSLLLHYKLISSSKFDVYSYCDINNNLYAVDEDNRIHIINLKEGKCDLENMFNDTNANIMTI